MRASEIIDQLTSGGGRIWLAGDKVRVRLPEPLHPLADAIRDHKAELIAELAQRVLDRLRPPFVRWSDNRIHLDAKALALRQPPRWSTSISALHRDCCAWMSGHDPVVPPPGDEFRFLLRELGCSLRTIRGDEFVDYVALKEDVQAHEQFQRLPMSSDPEQPVPEPLPVPATASVSAPEGIALPVGVRLVSWQPVQPPIRLTESETVLDGQKFVTAALQQLAAELRGQHWLGSNWGVQGLLDRLAACGCIVEIDKSGGRRP